MTISKNKLDTFAVSFNMANAKDDEPMQNRAKDGASIVLGAMNGYLYLMREDEPGIINSAEYIAVRNAFQDVANWFVTGLDIEEWTPSRTKGKGCAKIKVEP